MIYSYSLYAKKYFERFANNKDLISLSANLDEVFNNVFDHAQSPITGYIITQYYPKNNKLSFSICDFGIGIPSSINNKNIENNFPIMDDWKSIIKSLEKGFSVNSTPRNRGFGLNNIIEFTESSNGKLTIISNNGIVEKSANSLYKAGKTEYEFKGTLIKVEVDLNTFQNKNEHEEIFDL